MAVTTTFTGSTTGEVVLQGISTSSGGQTTINCNYGAQSDRRKILTWLTPKDPSKYHEDVLHKQRLHDKSGSWLLGKASTLQFARVYRAWRDDGKDAVKSASKPSLLWLTGLPEVGKTVTVALAIENIRSSFKNSENTIGICFSYLRMVGDPSREVSGQVLRLLLRQLLAGLSIVPNDVRKLYTACFENDTSPSDDRILACLKKVCGEHHDKVFIAIDGLDECTEEEQVTLVQYLKEMPSNTRIMVASRYLPIIEQRLDTKLRVNVYPHADDVRRYLETEMKCNSTFGRLMNSGTTGKSGDLRSMVEAAVLSNSGSFLAMNLHVKRLMKSMTAQELRKAISQPAGNTGEQHEHVYRRLQEQDSGKWEWAKKIFTWVCYGGKKYSLEELTYLVGLDPSEPDLQHTNQLDMEALTEVCSGLVICHKNSDTVALAHNSTHQFFLDHQVEYFPGAYKHMSRVCIAHMRAAAQSGHRISMESLEREMPDLTTTISMHIASQLLSYLQKAQYHDVVMAIPSVSSWPRSSETMQTSEPYSLQDDILKLLRSDEAREYTLRAINLSSQWDHENKRICGTYSSRRDEIDRSSTPIHAAARLGLTNATLEFASDRSLLDAKDASGRTALMVAVENGFFDLADQLAKQGANVNLDSSAGQDVFVTAINKGNVPFVDQMICSAGTRTLSFAEATLFAAYHGNEEKIPTPEEYSQINSPQLEGPLVSALLVATDRCHNRVLTRIVDIITGCYPSDRIQSILDHADQTGRTALHRAAAQRRPLVVTYLLSKGASPDWPSNLTAWAEVVRVQDNDEVLSVLNKWGADPNTKDFEGVSVLYQAAASGNLTVVKRCLNAGTDPNIQTIYKWAPLHWAASNGHFEVVECLLEWKADVDILSDSTKTPLDVVVSSSKHEHFIKNVLFEKNYYAGLVQSQADDFQPSLTTSSRPCQNCETRLHPGSPVYCCTICEDYILCDICVWAGCWCKDKNHDFSTAWQYSHLGESMLLDTVLEYAVRESAKSGSMVALLKSHGARLGYEITYENDQDDQDDALSDVTWSDLRDEFFSGRPSLGALGLGLAKLFAVASVDSTHWDPESLHPEARFQHLQWI